jgi:hypothetical protein
MGITSQVHRKQPMTLTLADFHDRHRGETILVCGCGSSLLKLPDPGQCITVGVNDIGRLFQPSYLVVVNPRGQFKQDRFQYVESTRAQAVFTQVDLGIGHPQVVRFRLGKYGGTDFDDPNCLHFTQNSPYVAVCLAAHMGAKRIGLIGVDFTDDHFFGKTGNHPLARKLGEIDQEYTRLAEALAGRGGELINLSKESRLTGIPKQSCDRFLRPVGEEPQVILRDCRSRFSSLSATDGYAEASPNTSAPFLRVVHIAKTNCAGSFWNLHHLLTNYTMVESRVITASTVTNGRHYPRDVLLSQRQEVANLLDHADVVHFHNWLDKQSLEMVPFADILAKKPCVLQFHSEPTVLQRSFHGRDPRTRKDILTLVIAQKHARFFPLSIPVPNAIDIHHPLLQPADSDRDGILRVLFTPTDTHCYPDYDNTCRGKGYQQTVDVLQVLQQKGLLKATIRTELGWKELMLMRRKVDVVIDECVTGGYHLTSLEALSQGLATIAFLDERTRKLVCDLTGSALTELPWINTTMERLAPTLELIAENPMLLRSSRRASRAWMTRYWRPEFVARHYIQAYERAIAKFARDWMDAASKPKFHDLASATVTSNGHATCVPMIQSRDSKFISYRLSGSSNPKRSEDFPQTIRLGKELLSQKGILAGKPCHILGNGPSVSQLDLSLLDSRTLIGVNASPLLQDALGRTTDYYCVSDRRFLGDEGSRSIAQSVKESIRVFAGYCFGFLIDPEIHYVRICGGDGISDDLVQGVYHNCSVVLFAAQLALWLGSTELFLHGCEFDYRDGRFCGVHNNRPHDRGIYPRVERNVKSLVAYLTRRGGSLHIVGPSRLVGDFGSAPIAGVHSVSVAVLGERLERSKSLSVRVARAEVQ